MAVYNVDENLTCSIDSNEYLSYVSFAGLSLGLGLGLGLVTAGLHCNTG